MAKETLKEFGCELDFSFIMNLTILTDEILDFSREHSISYGVSLDGVENYHDSNGKYWSGVGTFEIVDANIKRLLAHNITVSTSTVVNDDNLAGLPDLTGEFGATDHPNSEIEDRPFRLELTSVSK